MIKLFPHILLPAAIAAILTISCDSRTETVSHVTRTDWSEDVLDGINAFMGDNAL